MSYGKKYQKLCKIRDLFSILKQKQLKQLKFIVIFCIMYRHDQKFIFS